MLYLKIYWEEDSLFRKQKNREKALSENLVYQPLGTFCRESWNAFIPFLIQVRCFLEKIFQLDIHSKTMTIIAIYGH